MRPPTKEPTMPMTIVCGMLIGFGPGTASRPSAPMTRPWRTSTISRTRIDMSILSPVEGRATTGSRMAEVRAEIAASVWQVRTEVGATVAEGDELVILESMKMEIPVISPVAGTVAEVRVAPEDQVQEGDVVAVIDEG